MACELLGTAWVEAVRRRTQSGTVRETAGGWGGWTEWAVLDVHVQNATHVSLRALGLLHLLPCLLQGSLVL